MAYTTINKSSEHFNTKLYTGNGSTQSITGVGFQPDLVWGKNRSSVTNHSLQDAVRGNTKVIKSSTSGAETTITNMVTSFDSDGFSLGADSDMNGSSANQVAWNWLANGAGSANTDGSISSTVSVNTTSGFSIVKWTGTGANATVGHGLGVAPKMILIKNTIDAVAWEVGHDAIGWTKKLRLNATDAEAVDSGAFNNTAPTSSVFSLGTNNTSNDSGDSMIAYCFADVQGYSKFSSYTGNGSGTDGTFVYTGFSPSFIMFKSTSTTGGWEIHDNKRDTFNPSSKRLFPNLSNAEATENYVDFVSNGFKFRTGDATGNTNGTSYIYMAFAEAPLVGTNGVTAKAR